MVGQLPKSERKKALTWGILGAYLFRGLALLFASFLIKLTWLKVVGGLYLIYLAIKSLKVSSQSNVEAIARTTQSLFSDLAVAESEYPLIALEVEVYGSGCFILQRYGIP